MLLLLNRSVQVEAMMLKQLNQGSYGRAKITGQKLKEWKSHRNKHPQTHLPKCHPPVWTLSLVLTDEKTES